MNEKAYVSKELSAKHTKVVIFLIKRRYTKDLWFFFVVISIKMHAFPLCSMSVSYLLQVNYRVAYGF